LPPPRHVEPERVAIERLRPRDITHAQMHVTDAQPVGRALISRGGRNLAQNAVDIERIGGDLQIGTGPFPSLGRPIAVDLDAIAFGIVEIERLAYRMIGRARQRHLVARDVEDPTRQIAARRHEEGGVIEAGLARIVGLGAGLMLEVNERHATGPEHNAILAAIEHGEPKHVAVEATHAIDVTHFEADRPDMQRSAACKGRDGGRVEGIHASYIDPSVHLRNSGPTAGCRRKSHSIGSPGPVKERCMSVDADTVRRIAQLARIAVAEEEVEHLRGELNAILAFVEQLSAVAVAGIEPMTSVIPMAMKKREDMVTDGGTPDEIIKNAPAAEDHFFVVPKVVE
jgi:aspartyl-tRNA(Asn)/glutamyl-tRNA(Gln) amidotransferase subunit C